MYRTLARALTGRLLSPHARPAPPGRPAPQRTICLVGASRTGKTSLLRRLMDDSFDATYMATSGTLARRARVSMPAGEFDCTFRDPRGDEPDYPVEFLDLCGMAGYVLVVDGCRPETFDTARTSVERIERGFGSLPFVLAINKADRFSSWRPPAAVTAWLAVRSAGVVHTSARTGQGVDQAVALLAGRLGVDSHGCRAAGIRVTPDDSLAAKAA